MGNRHASEPEPLDPHEVDARFKELTEGFSLTLGPRDYVPPPEVEEDFAPPPPAPLPLHRTTLITSWVMALGGLVMMLVIALFFPTVPQGYALIGVGISVAGWLLLLWHMPKDKPPHENDDGAVV